MWPATSAMAGSLSSRKVSRTNPRSDGASDDGELSFTIAPESRRAALS